MTGRIAALVLALVAWPALAADGAADQLGRLRHALDTLQYQGVFVYLHDGQVDSMQVTRSIGPRGTREHIVSLTGDRRQVLREGNTVQFLLPAGLMTLTGGRDDGDASAFAQAAAHYDIEVTGHSRVAGYEAAVVDARPRDAHRYGYRLWIERETGMLLGSALLGSDGNPIEQLLFTSLEMKPAPAARPAAAAPAAPDTAEPGQWTVDLPEGFRLIARPAAERDAEHQLFSDGLANVSLYVEPLRSESADWTGSSRRGAIAVVGRVRGGYHVVVMGDLPVATVERIADSVQPRIPN
ncbi:MAG TPA: MucB/RseB C-terminal domain-containing protein [Xanthomonadales bacterium]|nr:MucB/RseB C-terminal domain-containing protein [Xanthomonadales bacterium]